MMHERRPTGPGIDRTTTWRRVGLAGRNMQSPTWSTPHIVGGHWRNLRSQTHARRVQTLRLAVDRYSENFSMQPHTRCRVGLLFFLVLLLEVDVRGPSGGGIIQVDYHTLWFPLIIILILKLSLQRLKLWIQRLEFTLGLPIKFLN